MSALQRFENRLEEMISGVFARTFRSAVQPVEISAALNREIDNSAQILSRDRRLVPNAFHVELSPTDHDRLSQLGPQLTGELVSMLRDHAARQSYVFTGPVTIDLETSEDLTTGRFRVRSQSLSNVSQPNVSQPDVDQPRISRPHPSRSAETQHSGEPVEPPTNTEVRRPGAVLVVNGKELPLSAPGLVIGRGNDADLRIDDPGISRRHVELRVIDTAGGQRISAHDLGSTNGVVVDGRRVEKATLSDGSELRIGNTTMTLRTRHQGAG